MWLCGMGLCDSSHVLHGPENPWHSQFCVFADLLLLD